MPERKRKWRIFLLHIILLPTVMYVFYFFTLGPKPYTGVDEAVVEKVAKEHGREARPPLVNMDGDLLLFAFLVAGAVGGFAGGYYWRMLVSEKKAKNGPNDSAPQG